MKKWDKLKGSSQQRRVVRGEELIDNMWADCAQPCRGKKKTERRRTVANSRA